MAKNFADLKRKSVFKLNAELDGEKSAHVDTLL